MYKILEIEMFFEVGTFELGVLYYDRERLYGSDYSHRRCLGNIK